MAASVTIGFIACAISAVFFGSMYVPLKKYNATDGVFVQWVMGCALFCVGLVVGGYENFQPFYPLAMFGGAVWATGNVVTIPIINRIGMTIGVLLWNFTNLLSGWACGRFGWFGIHPQIPNNEALNYVGLTLSLISTAIFAFVKMEPPPENYSQLAVDESDDTDSCPILPPAEVQHHTAEDVGDNGQVLSPVVIYRKKQRIIGIVAALFAGVLFGLCYFPVVYIQDNNSDAPKTSLPYFFAFCCGAFGMCTVYFVLYAVYKQNRPVIIAETALPAFAAGTMFAVALAACFIAFEALSVAVSYPILSRFPGVITALWGVFVFKEIQGRKNLLMLSLAIVITVIGGVLSGLSKVL